MRLQNRISFGLLLFLPILISGNLQAEEPAVLARFILQDTTLSPNPIELRFPITQVDQKNRRLVLSVHGREMTLADPDNYLVLVEMELGYREQAYLKWTGTVSRTQCDPKLFLELTGGNGKKKFSFCPLSPHLRPHEKRMKKYFQYLFDSFQIRKQLEQGF